jgi:hypothetical protein
VTIPESIELPAKIGIAGDPGLLYIPGGPLKMETSPVPSPNFTQTPVKMFNLKNLITEG